jgi:hypothetical protein
MDSRCSVWLTGSIVGLALLLMPGSAGGQAQTRAQQGCINAMLKGARLVAAAQGKLNLQCVKNEGGGGIGDVDVCVRSDADGLVAERARRVEELAAKKCLKRPDQVPGFSVAGAALVNTAARDLRFDLLGRLFGMPVDAAIIPCAASREGCKCQEKVLKQYEKLTSTGLREYSKCIKLGLKAGSIVDPAGLEACLDSDPDGKISEQTAKLRTSFEKHCPPVPMPFPVQSAPCINFFFCTKCGLCLLNNLLFGQNANCDLKDDMVINCSCGPCPTPTRTRTRTNTPVPGVAAIGLSTPTPPPPAAGNVEQRR